MDILTNKTHNVNMIRTGPRTWIVVDSDVPENGVYGVGVGHYEIYINGQHIDTAYGTEWNAWKVYEQWKEAIANHPEVELYQDIPLSELPDSYFKNGRLRPLGEQEQEIPFQGEPTQPSEPMSERDIYGLDASYG